MQTDQRLWTSSDGWVEKTPVLTERPQLVLVFGSREELQKEEHFNSLRSFYPESHILLCSTAGEILGTEVRDGSLSVTGVYFEKTTLQFAKTTITDVGESEQKGRELAEMLPKENLVHAMVFSDGLHVNGTALVKGITAALPETVSVTGGLVGDGAGFKTTVTGLDEVPKENNIILIGFYGDALSVGYGSLGGWDTFGPDRTITRAKDNVLYELDGRPALELYKEYLGEQAAELPSSGLLFPIRLSLGERDGAEVVRTLLAVNEEEQSLVFAGDMPEGAEATLMRANFDRLIDGAYGAAKMSGESVVANPQLAILISCVGRKLILKDRIEEETEAVQSVLGTETVMTGFYSYGEICPVAATEKQCRLHNQTMTITTFREN